MRSFPQRELESENSAYYRLLREAVLLGKEIRVLEQEGLSIQNMIDILVAHKVFIRKSLANKWAMVARLRGE
jgi:hypothetical protein